SLGGFYSGIHEMTKEIMVAFFINIGAAHSTLQASSTKAAVLTSIPLRTRATISKIPVRVRNRNTDWKNM
ncbi:hypothetical protein Z043-113002, partial [Arapaima gigas]